MAKIAKTDPELPIPDILQRALSHVASGSTVPVTTSIRRRCEDRTCDPRKRLRLLPLFHHDGRTASGG